MSNRESCDAIIITQLYSLKAPLIGNHHEKCGERSTVNYLISDMKQNHFGLNPV